MLRVRLVATCLAVAACASSPAAPTYRTVPGDGVGLHTRLLGSGSQVVVLLHGGPGLNLEEMTPFDPLRTQDRTLVSYDQRGAGRTGTARDPGLAAQVADVDAVRRAVHADRIWLVGQSWGGLLAAAYAAAHPDRVAGLALVDAAPPDLHAFETGQQAFAQRLTQLQRQGLVPSPLPGPSHGSCLPTLTAELPVYAADPAHPPRQPSGVTCTAGTAAAVYADAIREPVLSGVATRLHAFRGPALVLTGAADAFGPSWPAAWQEVLPQATTVTVPGAGHDPVLEQPKAVLDAVDRLLRR